MGESGYYLSIEQGLGRRSGKVNRKIGKSKNRRIEESKNRRIEESKNRRIEESKNRRIEESKRRTGLGGLGIDR